jgi:hypothetical protein
VHTPDTSGCSAAQLAAARGHVQVILVMDTSALPLRMHDYITTGHEAQYSCHGLVPGLVLLLASSGCGSDPGQWSAS